MRKFAMAATAATTLMVAACAGRAPAPVQTVQLKDMTMDCNAIQAELSADTTRLAALGKEKGDKATQNVVAGVAGALLSWPALFLMDFQGAAETDSKALELRDQVPRHAGVPAMQGADRSTRRPAGRGGPTMIKVLAIIVLTPLLLCIGVYGRTAAHVALLTH